MDWLLLGVGPSVLVEEVHWTSPHRVNKVLLTSVREDLAKNVLNPSYVSHDLRKAVVTDVRQVELFLPLSWPPVWGRNP